MKETTPNLHKCWFCGYEKIKIETKKTGVSHHGADYSEIYSATARCNRCHARGPAQSYTRQYVYRHTDDSVLQSNMQRENEAKRIAAEMWNDPKGAD